MVLRSCISHLLIFFGLRLIHSCRIFYQMQVCRILNVFQGNQYSMHSLETVIYIKKFKFHHSTLKINGDGVPDILAFRCILLSSGIKQALPYLFYNILWQTFLQLLMLFHQGRDVDQQLRDLNHFPKSIVENISLIKCI